MQPEEQVIINFHEGPSALFLRTKDIAIAEKRIDKSLWYSNTLFYIALL